MNKQKKNGIFLLIGALVVLAGGTVSWMLGHVKSGMGLIGVGVVLIAVSFFIFFSRASSEKVQLDKEWM